MTRRSVLEIVRAAKQNRWTVVLGGPESANYLTEYLGAGADVIVIGEGELTLTELIAALAQRGPHRLHEVCGVAFRDETGAIVRTAERAKIPDLDSLPWPDREAIDHQLYLDAWKTHHGASSINLITARGCPVSLQLVLARGVWLHAPAAQPVARGRRGTVDRRALRTGPGVVRR